MRLENRAFANVAVGILVVCAVALSVANFGRAYFAPASMITPPTDTIREWRTIAAAGQRTGGSAPLVTIVAFYDYQCPFCKRFNASLSKLQRHYGTRLAVVWRQYPAPAGHPFAKSAATAAICAGRFGRFSNLHHVLFDDASRFGQVSMALFAFKSGVEDTSTFNACMRDSTTARALERDIAAGDRLRIQGTPTFLVDSLMFSGMPNDLDRIIRREMRLAVAHS